jgi:hypothetical protein
MPVGAGIMQIATVNVYRTAIEISSISPSITVVKCGDDIEFFVSVTSSNPSYAVNDGYFYLINADNHDVIGGGNISAGSGSTGLISGLSGILRVYARYTGTYNEYMASTSPIKTYIVPKQNSTISITDPTNGSYYCYYQPVSITALVQAASSGTPSGNVLFKLYLDDDNYISLSSGEINEFTGEATIEMPALTGDLDGYVKYIQATYLGDYCYNSSYTDIGTSGIEIIPTLNDTTYITIDSMVGPSFPIANPITFGATVTGSSLSAPDGYDGYVKFEYRNIFGGPKTELGISYLTNGIASLTVVGNTFPSIGPWIVSADFYSESDCYDSTSVTSTTTITIT